ncbi:MAG: carboxypeptidase regulatory-like domain-containing protein, partial [Anaerolineales bacterium]|nr:carboxypeptidase regulatory-like domain-containing protein [Anaerolineales bacterium]
SEPGVCYIPPTPTPLPQGSISGYVYAGYSSSVSSERLQNVTVTLGQGSCSSSGYKSTTTNSEGYYSFTQLPPGTYCVTVIKSTLPPASYGWGTTYPSGFPSPPGANPYHQENLAPNGTINNVNFGFQRIIG